METIITLTKFQQQLKDAIQECYCMKPVNNNEDVKRWKEHHEKAQKKLNDLIERAVDINTMTFTSIKTVGKEIKGIKVQI